MAIPSPLVTRQLKLKLISSCDKYTEPKQLAQAPDVNVNMADIHKDAMQSLATSTDTQNCVEYRGPKPARTST